MDPLNLIGTTVEQKYEVTHFVGEGGFSVVYRARHKVWDQDVALKVFKLSGIGNEETRKTLRDAFVREGKLMAELSGKSSAIVQARDIGTIHGSGGDWSPFMVLEWLAGESLEAAFDAVQRGHEPRWDLADTIGRLDSAAAALALAHRFNVVHRDLKPGNLFFVYDENRELQITKVLDFGVAKVMQDHLDADEALKQTTAQLNAFTPRYGAPEQFSRSYGATGPWTDVFAFALIVLEALLGGESVLKGDDFLSIANQSTDPEQRPTPQALGLDVSDEVEAVFARALSITPQARYADMGSFWRDLRGAAFTSEHTWTPVGLAGASHVSARSDLGGSSATLSHSDSASHSRSMVGDEQTLDNTAPTTPPLVGRLAMIGLATFAVGAVVLTTFVNLPEETTDAPATTASSSPESEATEPGQQDAAPSPPPAPALPPLSERCPDGMALVPGGKFYRGSDDATYARWQPAHKVTLDPYCLDLREVTAKQYKGCSDAGGCKRLPARSSWQSSASAKEQAAKEEAFSTLCNFGVAEREEHPINCISWADAQNYCNERGARLPTEAEWEFAARGSDGRSFPWGDTPPDHTMMNACGEECTRWHEDNDLRPSPQMYEQDDGFPGTAPVGTFPNGRTMFGMDDMVGNVFEWTEDWFAVYDNPPRGPLTNPSGPDTGEKRVVRGGAFNGGFALWVNPAFRYGMNPVDHSHGVGMRCALTPKLLPEERLVDTTTKG